MYKLGELLYTAVQKNLDEKTIIEEGEVKTIPEPVILFKRDNYAEDMSDNRILSIDWLYSQEEHVSVTSVKKFVPIEKLLEYCLEHRKYPYMVDHNFISNKTISIPFNLLTGDYTIDQLNQFFEEGTYHVFLVNLSDIAYLSKEYVSKFPEFYENTLYSVFDHLEMLNKMIDVYKQASKTTFRKEISFSSYFETHDQNLDVRVHINTVTNDITETVIQPVNAFVISSKIFPTFGFLQFDSKLKYVYRSLPYDLHCNIRFKYDDHIFNSRCLEGDICYGDYTKGFHNLHIFKTSNADSRYQLHYSPYYYETLLYLLEKSLETIHMSKETELLVGG